MRINSKTGHFDLKKIRNKSYLDTALKNIISELSSLCDFRFAIKLATKISDQDYKDIVFMEISIEMLKNGEIKESILLLDKIINLV